MFEFNKDGSLKVKNSSQNVFEDNAMNGVCSKCDKKGKVLKLHLANDLCKSCWESFMAHVKINW